MNNNNDIHDYEGDILNVVLAVIFGVPILGFMLSCLCLGLSTLYHVLQLLLTF